MCTSTLISFSNLSGLAKPIVTEHTNPTYTDIALSEEISQHSASHIVTDVYAQVVNSTTKDESNKTHKPMRNFKPQVQNSSPIYSEAFDAAEGGAYYEYSTSDRMVSQPNDDFLYSLAEPVKDDMVVVENDLYGT